MREKIEKIFAQYGHSEAIDQILNLFSDPIKDADIEWVGECDKCKGKGEYILSYPRPGGNPSYQNRTCEACNGTGKVTRLATIVEVLEAIVKLMAAPTPIYEPLYLKALTVNNGRLRVKDKWIEMRWGNI